jgi:methylated-DNA-[protein]-cysteine S-methyltransferase
MFETAIGPCAIAWAERGIVGLQLPEASVAAARARMKKRFPSSIESKPPREAARTIRDITALLAGKRVDLKSVPLDFEGVPPFHRRAYEAARGIEAGQTRSYGELARTLGSPNSSRAVGQAMRRNPFPIVVPCHRVLASGGGTGGFTAEGGVDTKLRMLEIEGAVVGGGEKKGRSSKAAPTNGKLSFDPRAALRELAAADPDLARLIAEVGPFGMKLKETGSVFGALAEAIVYQQLTGKAAATIYGRVCALFPKSKHGFAPKHILGASDEALRGAGLSRAKVAALRDLAERTESGELPTLAGVRRMDDAAIVEALTKVRGIGRWTVEMLLIFRLGRTDILPVDDYGVRKGYAIAFRKKDLPAPKDLARYGERWKPWRSVASWYLWRATDTKPIAPIGKHLAKVKAAARAKAGAPTPKARGTEKAGVVARTTAKAGPPTPRGTAKAGVVARPKSKAPAKRRTAK